MCCANAAQGTVGVVTTQHPGQTGKSAATTDQQHSPAVISMTAGELLDAVAARRQETAEPPAAVHSSYFIASGALALLAFGLLFLRFGDSGSLGAPLSEIPASLVWVFAITALIFMIAAAGIPVLRAVRSSATLPQWAQLYVAAWGVTVVAVLPVLWWVANAAPKGHGPMYALSLVVLVVGVGTIFDAAVWRNPVQFLYGGTMLMSVTFAVASGPGFYALNFAAALGGGGFVAALVNKRLRSRHPQQ